MENALTPLPRTTRKIERRFFSTMAALLTLAVAIGFARTYYLRPLFNARPLAALIHLHGLVFSGWMILLIVQTRLVASGRTNIHRRLGMMSLVLAVSMEVFGILAALTAALDGDHLKGMTTSATMAIQLTNMVTFPLLFGAGIYWRRNAAAHKRLMLLASLAIMSPAYVRIIRQCCGFIPIAPVTIGYLLVDLCVVTLVAYDWRTQGRLHRATLWGGLFLLASHPFRFWLGTTSGWERFATWLLGMV